jgi:transcriptional regulator with XRE-family HTH domain
MRLKAGQQASRTSQAILVPLHGPPVDSNIPEKYSILMDMDAQLSSRLRALRGAAGLTLEALAESSGVSRSMISLIERCESSPTANVLDRLAAALGVTMASLFDQSPDTEASPLARRADQQTWVDPETGYVRRNLSPRGYASPVDLVEVTLPAGARVAYDSAVRSVVVHQQIWVLEGLLELRIGDEVHRLEPGDCLAMRLDRPISFNNRNDAPTRYLVALTASEPRAGIDTRREAHRALRTA